MILRAFKLGPKRSRHTLAKPTQLCTRCLDRPAASKQPIDEEGLVKASQDVLKENHRALHVLQAKIAGSGMTEAEVTA